MQRYSPFEIVYLYSLNKSEIFSLPCSEMQFHLILISQLLRIEECFNRGNLQFADKTLLQIFHIAYHFNLSYSFIKIVYHPFYVFYYIEIMHNMLVRVYFP